MEHNNTQLFSVLTLVVLEHTLNIHASSTRRAPDPLKHLGTGNPRAGFSDLPGDPVWPSRPAYLLFPAPVLPFASWPLRPLSPISPLCSPPSAIYRCCPCPIPFPSPLLTPFPLPLPLPPTTLLRLFPTTGRLSLLLACPPIASALWI